MNKTTEERNSESNNLDIMPLLDILSLMNNQDLEIPSVIKNHLIDIEMIIKQVIRSFNNNGRLFYVGCGTSGRLGVLDASECPPTFKVSTSLVQGIIAGGSKALYQSVEGAEDSYKDGQKIVKNKNINHNDTVIGVSASGTADYVLGCLEKSKDKNAYTALITFNKIKSKRFIDKILSVIVGPELISGSTRMKAGTATKMILNMISTSSLIKSNKVYKNYMVDLKVSNKKLKNRAINIIKEICKVTASKAEQLLQKSNNDVKVAIVMSILRINNNDATKLLNDKKGDLRKIIK